jgi:hypothetical protein
MSEPIIVKKKAIDVVPYFHGIYCTVGGGEPFVNHICHRRWADDGQRITFMLETHNFDFRHPDEEMEVVELVPSEYNAENAAANDAKFRAGAPMSDVEYSRLWAL